MFWADKIAQDLAKFKKPQLVDDAKTPSGQVHVGALRGVIIHDLIFKALQDEKVEARYTFVIDDMDPMDSLPTYLSQEKFESYMGFPLKDIPSPEGEGSFAQYYANEFIEVFNKLGAKPEILWNSNLYKEGVLDRQIKQAFEAAEKIQEIYEKISGSKRPKDFIPFQPICENCGKIGTTQSTDWDGEKVHYECVKNKVGWAQGCDYKGKVSPFGGTGKLSWRVEWPAKWAALGVTVEGEGKDHSSKGGSRDTADAIAKEIFDYEPPYDILYEHFLFGGRKMSSSKGIGVSAKEVSEMLPADVLRFLMVASKPNQHLDFDPGQENTIPKLFDDFDSARASKNPDLQRIYTLSSVEKEQENYFVPRFRDLINPVQMPNIDIEEWAEKEKGSKLTPLDKEKLQERLGYVKIYLERFAPEHLKFDVKENLPPEAKNLNSKQKEFLIKAIDLFDKKDSAEDFQNDIYQTGKDLGLSSQEIFQAIYRTLLGKDSGPKAAWLILSLDRDFIEKRFRLAAGG